MTAPAVSRLSTFVLLLLPAVVLEVIADVFFKKWALNSRGLMFFLGVLGYFAATILWGYSLKFDLMSRLISVFMVLNLVAVIAVGVLYFNEKLRPINMVGIALGILSVILCEL
jgi:drug/metabolite transporter (DMT)-like permease